MDSDDAADKSGDSDDEKKEAAAAANAQAASMPADVSSGRVGLIPDLKDVVKVTSGEFHAAALTSDVPSATGTCGNDLMFPFRERYTRGVHIRRMTDGLDTLPKRRRATLRRPRSSSRLSLT